MSFQQRHDMLYLNNRCVEYIHCNDYDNAISTLTQALTTLRECTATAVRQEQQQLQDQDQQEHRQQCFDNEDYAEEEDQEEDISEWFSRLVLSMSDMAESSSSPSLFTSTKSTTRARSSYKPTTTAAASPSRSIGYVYDHPLELPMDDHVALRLSVLRLTIMFNLAIAFHLKGMYLLFSTSPPTASSTSDKNGVQRRCREDIEAEAKWSFESAMKLYELTYEIMGTHEQYSCNVNPGMYFIMSLANNLGMVHVMLCQYEHAQQCFQHLLSMQMYLMENNPNHTTTSFHGSDNSNEVGSIGSDNSDEDNCDENQMMSDVAIADDGIRIEPGARPQEDYQQSQLSHQEQQHPWDGFFHNTSQLILNDCCASAA